MGAHFKFANNTNQRTVMAMVLEAADAGEFITLKNLSEKLPGRSKQAVQSTVSKLKHWGFLVTNFRGRAGTQIIPTAQAYSRFR